MSQATERINLSPEVADEVKYTTCYMCACRCGIKVHLRDGHIRYIEGNRDHPVNAGVLCAKGSAGIMHQQSPAKLRKPLKRVGERGEGKFEEIEWDEALELATSWLADIRRTDPRKLAFFTGRDQSQSLTGFWASQFGTPNHAAHGGFCSVNMAAAGLYTIGGSFWEFGEPDWDRARYVLLFGIAEDHDSNPIKMGLGKLKTRGDAKVVSVNPVRTGYSGIADEWIGIKPGTDGLFVLALVHELLRNKRIDLTYLARYTNASWLIMQAPGTDKDGLVARDDDGFPLIWDEQNQGLARHADGSENAVLFGRFEVTPGVFAVPSLELIARRYLDDRYSPDEVAAHCSVPAHTIRRIAAELAEAAFEQQIELDIPWTDSFGRHFTSMVGRPVSMHAMRGISAHSNGFQTCRAIHLLQILLGTIDTPGGMRYKAPFPKGTPPGPRPAGDAQPLRPLSGPPLGWVFSPDDLLLESDGKPQRIDKAYSWEAPLAAHGLMHMVIRQAWAADPYPIDTLFMYMANMGWNSAMNSAETIKMLTDRDKQTGEYKIPHIIYSDAFASETVAYADLVLPDTTYLERWDCISLLDRPIGSAEGPGDAIRQPVLQPDRDVRPFQDVLIDLGARLNLPAFVDEDSEPRYPGGYPDYLVNHVRAGDVGPLAGWRGAQGDLSGIGEPNADQLQRYIDNGCYWHEELPQGQQYYKHVNADYLRYANKMGWVGSTDPIVLQLYCEPLQRFRLAAQGHGDRIPPDQDAERIKTYFDPLPVWYPPHEGAQVDESKYPLHAITQRPMAMYHSWGSQNAWLRQIHGSNRLFIHQSLAEKNKLQDDDWVWLESHHARIKVQIKTMTGCNPDTVWTWNAIGKRKGAWQLSEQAEEANEGFLLNHLISDLLPDHGGKRYPNADPITGQAAWFDLRVSLTKAPAADASLPQFESLQSPPGLSRQTSDLRYGEQFLPAGNWRRKEVDRS